MENYCKKAVDLGIDCMCFTEHADNNPNDEGTGYYRPNAFFDAFHRMQDLYGDKVKLLAGLEFSEPHLYRAELESYGKYPYDFIIGSVHYWDGDLFPSGMLEQGISLEDCYRGYWAELLKTVKCGGFHCVGHLDFPKRYYKELLYDEGQMREILSTMVSNGIVLEVNTSSLRVGLTEAMPSRGILNLYKECGGRDFTMGSDAHTAANFYAYIDEAKKIPLSMGLREVYYEKGRASC